MPRLPRSTHYTFLSDPPSNHTIPFFFFNDTATTEIYTLSLHDALPISRELRRQLRQGRGKQGDSRADHHVPQQGSQGRSEEHTSELQSPCNLVCRLLLEKKKYRTHILSSVTHMLIARAEAMELHECVCQ